MNVKNVSQRYNGYFGDFNETIVDMIYDFACELCQYKLHWRSLGIVTK